MKWWGQPMLALYSRKILHSHLSNPECAVCNTCSSVSHVTLVKASPPDDLLIMTWPFDYDFSWFSQLCCFSFCFCFSGSSSGRQVKMAFIHSAAKPPRNVRIQQELHGTAGPGLPHAADKLRSVLTRSVWRSLNDLSEVPFIYQK